ncbi:hypothetical protein HU200_029154 [Digitaria exilis]|uniref:Protein kinase domain-containing protein n=1 Tax=Digitaria exilis TaxID=1010633 RepID=A0A835BTD7_9POAL|nr:hypothetical protein HU200_029154 [Digitaria exilis]
MGNEARRRALLLKTTDFDTIESMLQDPDPYAAPLCLPIDFLKAITLDFSREQELGRGGHGVVYKGVLQNGKAIAVKKLSEMHLEDAQFHNEVTYLIGLKHQNIVQLVGYCAESRWEATQVRGKYVMAEIRKRLLCFEYVNNKSLEKYISAESCGLEWHWRYDMIRGICSGLHYLHTECRIVHLDLKPENILLDDNMVPKITDFGISRLFGQQQSRVITESREGTLGYMAPEYLRNGLISNKSDIFSFGVIVIELITGSRDYPQSGAFGQYMENVAANWRNRLEKVHRYMPLEIYSQQVNTCIMIGLKCVDPDPEKRPAALDIIQMLDKIESTDRLTSVHVLSLPKSFGPIIDKVSTSKTANTSSAFTFSGKGTKAPILAFQIANTVVKGSCLMNTVSKQNIQHLKEGVLRSKGVRLLISEDYSQLLHLVQADIR